MLPLSGLTVIAVEQAVAAPFCSSRLADAGAHVIKIERPEGDFARGYDAAAKGQSSYFVWLNRGKDSVVVDLATSDGRQELENLIASADVLIQNLKPGAMDKLGFSLARLRADYPKLICCTISGYGDDGPYAQRKAYDLLIQAESGLASITGGPEGPSRVGLSIVDIATGATAHAAILEALIGRGIHGNGADIRISMFDVMADWLAVPLLNSEAGNPPQRIGLAHPVDRALRRVPLAGRPRHSHLDPERTRVEEALRRRTGPAGAAVRSALCQHGRARSQSCADRQGRERRIRYNAARRTARATRRTPTLPSPRSTAWPTCRTIRICGASSSIPRTGR